MHARNWKWDTRHIIIFIMNSDIIGHNNNIVKASIRLILQLLVKEPQ